MDKKTVRVKAYGVRVPSKALAIRVLGKVLPRNHVEYTVVSERGETKLLKGLVTGASVRGYVLRYGSILVRIWYDNRRKMILVSSISPGAEEICEKIAYKIEEVVLNACGGRQASIRGRV